MRDLKYRKREGRKGAAKHARNVERVRMRITKGDTVRVMRGEDKGKEGKVLRVFPKTGRLTVDGVNVVKRHRKARRAEEQSGIIEFPAPIHASNVMLLDPKEVNPDTKAPLATRIRMRIDEDGTKERVSVKSGEPIARTR